jgi:hypothetical protein
MLSNRPHSHLRLGLNGIQLQRQLKRTGIDASLFAACRTYSKQAPYSPGIHSDTSTTRTPGNHPVAAHGTMKIVSVHCPCALSYPIQVAFHDGRKYDKDRQAAIPELMNTLQLNPFFFCGSPVESALTSATT